MKKEYNYTDIVVGLAILSGFLLTGFSYADLCSSHCQGGKGYTLYGQPFEASGFLFFSGLGVSHLLSRTKPLFSTFTGLLIASALGAEILFILLQKYVIGTYCPICLAIAATIAIAAAAFSLRYCRGLAKQIQQNHTGEVMRTIYRGFGYLSVVFAGFLMAFVGLGKTDPLDAAEDQIKQELYFGNENSPIEVFVFTDWNCPACRELEPYLARMSPALMKDAKVIFVDHALHPESLNYTPYNLSFQIHDKKEYFKLRGMLTKLSEKTMHPTEHQVEEDASKLGVTYQPLDYSDVALSIRYFKELSKQFNITSTPTMVIVNTETRKGKKLKGTEEITRRNALTAIKELTK